MKLITVLGTTSNILRVKLRKISTGEGFTGLTSSSTGLIISTIANNEASPTVYTVAASHVESISTLGTFAAPTASKCRFKEVDATNHPGLYEIQIADARFAVSNATALVVSISGVSDLDECDAEIQLSSSATPQVALTSGANDAITAAVLAGLIESGLTLQNALRIVVAMVAGKVTGGGSGTEVFKSGDVVSNALAGTKSRVTITDDSSGNRSASAVDLT